MVKVLAAVNVIRKYNVFVEPCVRLTAPAVFPKPVAAGALNA